MTAIIQEGLAQRSQSGVKGWICAACNYVMSFLSFSGGCPNCESLNIQPIKSPELLHEETEALKDKQRFNLDLGPYNAQSLECQTGTWLTPAQVLEIIQKWIPGARMFPQVNPHLGRTLMAFYIPWQWKLEEQAYVSQTELKGSLKFICCGEVGMMREWDYLPLTDDGMPLPYERGWRGVLGIFYRSGLIPFIPDDGNRIGWWQIKESPFKEKLSG